MKKPPVPTNEAERLRKLRDLRILDTPIEERFERITRMVCRTLDVPISAISLVDEDRQWFKSIQGLDVSETPRDIAFCAHAIMGDDPLVVADTLEDDRFTGNPLVTEDPNIRFYAGVPLNLGDNLRIGTLCAIDREPRDLDPEELVVLQDLSKMVESEIEAMTLTEEHQRLLTELEQAERAALIDSMTRLWNRGGGEQLLAREWEAAGRSHTAIAVAIIDIDHFKRVNDTHGHEVGDQVIKQFAQIILSAVRPYDIASRWGGEEFLVILPGCAQSDLPDMLQRLINSIRAHNFKTDAGDLKVTASVGAVCANPPTSEDPNHYVKMADQHLYKAKENGRNRYDI